MPDTLRTCAKTGCRWPAAASLSYRYATRQVWLLDLCAAPEPSLYDLCPHHADALTVPRGWERVDDRIDRPAVVEPSAHDRAEAAARRREPTEPATATATADDETGGGGVPVGAGVGGSRYARLALELPRLAAEVSATIPARPVPAPTPARPHVTSAPAPGGPNAPSEPAYLPAVAPRAHPATGAQRADAAGCLAPGALPLHGAVPVPSRELAPGAAVERAWTSPPDRPLDGQLVMPVDPLAADDLGADELVTDAVVVSIARAGSRRRGPRG